MEHGAGSARVGWVEEAEQELAAGLREDLGMRWAGGSGQQQQQQQQAQEQQEV